jgi:hypothetical protein
MTFKKKEKILIVIALFAVFLNVLIIQSRTVFFGIAISLLLCLLMNKTRKIVVIFIFYITICLSIFFGRDGVRLFTYLIEVSNSATSTQDESTSERQQAIQIGWNMFLENPVLGVGPGLTLLKHPITSSHQFNINQAAELGFIGGIGEVLSNSYTINNFPGDDIQSTDKLALLINPSNVEELVKGIELMIAHPVLAKALGQNARKEVLSNYTWDIHVEQILNGVKGNHEI